jgi:hypothetical protein
MVFLSVFSRMSRIGYEQSIQQSYGCTVGLPYNRTGVQSVFRTNVPRSTEILQNQAMKACENRVLHLA